MAQSNRPWILTAAIVALVGAPRPSAAAPPSKRAAVKKAAKAGVRRRKTSKRPRPSQRPSKSLQATSAEGTALVAAALLHYADRDGKTAADRRLRKALDNIPGGRAAAQRLAKRVRAAPAARKKKILGKNRGLLLEPTAPKRLAAALGRVAGSGHATRVELPKLEIELPPEDFVAPQDPEFEFAGVAVRGVDDPDGEDELVVVVKTLAPDLTIADQLILPTNGVLGGLSSGTTEAHQHPLSTPSNQFVLATAVAEADGNGSSVRADIEVAFQLAKTLALETSNTPAEGFDAFPALVAYTDGLLQLANGASSPSLSATRHDRKHRQQLWAAEAEHDGGVEYKTEVVHDIGGGEYALLFHVPAKHPKRTAVTVAFDEIRSLDRELTATEHIEVKVMIREEGKWIPLPMGKTVAQPKWRVSRRVQSGPVEIRIGAKRYGDPLVRDKWRTDFGQKRACGAYSSAMVKRLKANDYTYTADCPDKIETLDLHPGSRKSILLEYDPQTNKVRRDGKLLPKGLGSTLVITSGNKVGKRLKTKLRITDDNAAGKNSTAGKARVKYPVDID